ncbi:hypothetical protein LOTGIDRAFT_231303 [Lottia gigantea]|uniref:P-type domain-containing protein n=1 Tax=Lottia gigantea TaxID=225164 RepID=V4AZ35_LOTGI|nr:hypothetical protein LOTGIDRAFT_231303 [Lottia gigantea]ESO98986.1 hypothetical protein LOTGIDRAFT_231303 [Lottia gigantea]
MDADSYVPGSQVTFTTHRSNRRLIIVVLSILLLAVVIGVVVYFSTNTDENYSPTKLEKSDNNSDAVTPVLIDCYPENGANETRCEERGCIWREQKGASAPWCIYPEGHGYLLKGEMVESDQDLTGELTRIDTPRIYRGDIYDTLVVSIEYQTESRLRIKISPKGIKRYEVPKEALDIISPSTPPTADQQLYEVSVIKGPPQFGIKVMRKNSNVTVFSSDVPGLTFTDQFLQITTRLPSSNLYGFGEHNHRRFQHDMNWKTWSMFTRDIGVGGPENLYGVHPVYMNLENDGKATMVLLKNSNAMEITLQPDPNPAVTYRVIGGVLDFYIFMGPTPEQAVQQYLEAIGKPMMPPYWALGFQLCRWGYKDLDDMKMVIRRNREAGIPYDVQWGDIEYLYKKYLFTYDRGLWKDLPQVVDDLHDNNQYFIVIVDPAVGSDPQLIKEAKINSPGYDMYDDGVRQDIFIKNASGDVLIAEVWPGKTAYPDFTNPKTEDYWLKWMSFFYRNEDIKYDALWIDMNEPSSFVPGSIYGCENTTWDYPPYVPHIFGAGDEGKMYDKTLCMTSEQYWGKHYDVHSLYGHSHSIQTYNALLRQFPEKRPWTMTRSNFVGTGKYASKWMGDNQSIWPHLHWSIISIMEFSMFGFALNGADICGFWFEAEYEMCIRWHQLGAFYPFARNHNGRGDDPVIFKHQDPAAWDQRFIDIVKPVLMTRYRLLPYLYTLMFKAHQYGDMVMKALLFEFPTDKQTWRLDKQFLLGSALLVSPVLQQVQFYQIIIITSITTGTVLSNYYYHQYYNRYSFIKLLLSPLLQQNQTTVEAYFPQSRWYDYMTGEEVLAVGQIQNLYTPLDKFNLHIRGGYIIPVQQPDTTT